MKNIFERLKTHKIFENRVRLGIMSILMVNDWVDFRTLKDNLEITDGQLASNIKALRKMSYIKIRKQFIGNKPNTSYQATPSGRSAFNEYLNALEMLIKKV